MDWNDSKKWCEDNGMIMPEMHEMCPAWLEIGSDYMQGDICPELSSVITNIVWSATEYGYGTEKDSAFALHPTTGYVIYNGKGLYFEDDGNLAFCH